MNSLLNLLRQFKRRDCCTICTCIPHFKFYTMKRIFALMFSFGMVTVLFAQSGRGESRDVILGQDDRSVKDRTLYGNDRHYGHNDDYFSARERDQMIDKIRRDYNWKIESVKHNRYMRNGEKRREIRFLENERDAKIRAIWKRWNDRNHRS